MPLTVIDPATEEQLASYDTHNDAQARSAVESSHDAFLGWRRSAFAVRAKPMLRMAQLLVERRSALAELMAEEMGKPLADGRAEVEKCAWVCRYYAEHAESMLAPEPAPTEATESFVAMQPLGVVLAIMPWNFPFWQVFRFAAPTLMAGNGAILKHAENVPGCALAIEAIVAEAGFPPGLFRSLLLERRQVAALIEHPRVRAVTLTGSTDAGRAVGAQAAAALKPAVLELGGSDPYLVLADADVEHAAAIAVTSRLINGGQSCIAAKRLIVVETLRRRFEERVVALMAEATLGDPRQESVTLGPLARRDLRDALALQVRRSLDSGARCLLGGEVPAGKGFFYPPTVLSAVRPGMPAFDEELFGPVAAIVSASDDDEAVRLANQSAYGLGAAVFTADAARGRRIAEEAIDAGCCFVNDFVRSDPRLPFGGIKDSGYGRELGVLGIRAFVNSKSVYVA